MTVGAREQLIDGKDGAKNYSRFLPSAALSYNLTNDFKLFANAGKAFRAPSFNDLYYESDTRVGNPDLNPEEGWTYELGGAKFDNDMMRLRLAMFLMEYKEKIIHMSVLTRSIAITMPVIMKIQGGLSGTFR